MKAGVKPLHKAHRLATYKHTDSSTYDGKLNMSDVITMVFKYRESVPLILPLLSLR